MPSDDPGRTEEADPGGEVGAGWWSDPHLLDTGPCTQVPATRQVLRHFLGSANV